MASPNGMSAPIRRLISMAAVSVALGWLTIVTASASTVTVAAVNFEFKPASRSVNVGDVVRWTFAGDPHSVTSGVPGAPDGRFDSGITDPGGSFQITFDTAGTYRYFCQIHPEQMTGTIVVKAGSSPSPTPRSTAKPTARPTAQPTARPSASAAASPTSTASATTTASPSTAAPASPGASTAPTASPSIDASEGSPSAAPAASPVSPETASSVSPAAIVGGVIVLALLAAGALLVAGRGRSA